MIYVVQFLKTWSFILCESRGIVFCQGQAKIFNSKFSFQKGKIHFFSNNCIQVSRIPLYVGHLQNWRMRYAIEPDWRHITLNDVIFEKIASKTKKVYVAFNKYREYCTFVSYFTVPYCPLKIRSEWVNHKILCHQFNYKVVDEHLTSCSCTLPLRMLIKYG